MKVNSAFTSTRKPVLTDETLTLSATLISAGWKNFYASAPRSYHFHVINVHNFAVTIILDDKNRLFVRGVEYMKLDEMFSAIDLIKS